MTSSNSRISPACLTSSGALAANALTCTPSYASYLVEDGKAKLHLDVAQLGVRPLCLGAEPGGGVPEVRRSLGEAWNADVSESIGNADVIPIHSAECEYRHGNHFLVPHFLVLEIIDPVGSTVDPGHGLVEPTTC